MGVPTVKLSNGLEMPVIGLGTYESTDNKGVDAIKDAIDAGYRHIDSAFFYANEKEVGQGVRDKIKEGVVKREDMFIVTKLWNSFHSPEHVETAFNKSFENLGLDYIDLYLMHMPMGYEYRGFEQDDLLPKNADGKLVYSDVDYVETWKAMEKLVATGKIKSLGISNFNSEQIDRLLSVAKIKPVVNQVECSPSINQIKLTAFCKERDIALTAYSPLGRPHVAGNDANGPQSALCDAKVLSLSEKYKKSTAQIVLRFLVQLGVIPIPKSSNKIRIQENINIFDFELNDEEMDVLKTLNTNQRMCPFKLCLQHKYFPFNIDF